jgi:hypothetical protein
MTIRDLCGALTVTFTCGVMAVGTASAQRRDGNLMPQEQSGMITAAGCLLRGSQVRGGDNDNYALANPRRGPVSSVPDGSCTADPGAPALDLKDGPQNGLSDAMLGRWVEVIGELEKETSQDPDNLRELDVRGAKLIPVVPPQRTAAPPSAPEPRATPSPAPVVAAAAPPPVELAPKPRALPKTASAVPMIGMLGLLSLGGALALRLFRPRNDSN